MAKRGISDEYLVHWNEITHDQLADFKTTLDAAPNEAAMQTFLEQNPQVLIQPIGGGYDRWVISKVRLGAEHETDFLVAERDATRYVWYAVELERPQAKLFTGKGDPSADLTHAIRQIGDWRNWLSHNRNYASRPSDQAGLGLIDIDPELEGLIIMGREADVDPQTTERQARLTRENRIKIHTYDWLGERAREHLAALDERANEDPRVTFIGSIFDLPRSPSKRALETVFGSTGMASTDLSATRSVDWDFVTVENAEGAETDIVIKTVENYGQIVRRLSTPDWEDWIHYVQEEITEGYSLLLSKREPDEELKQSLAFESDGVWFQASEATFATASRLDVLVYLEQPDVVEDCINRVSVARQIFLRYVPVARQSFLEDIHAKVVGMDNK